MANSSFNLNKLIICFPSESFGKIFKVFHIKFNSVFVQKKQYSRDLKWGINEQASATIQNIVARARRQLTEQN